MNIIVQKFGGTSLADIHSQTMAVKKIIRSIKNGYTPIVVVSAMGRKGSPYATDTLIEFAKKIYNGIKPRELDMIMSCGEIISSVVIASLLNKNGYEAVSVTGYQAGIITDGKYNNSRVIKVDSNNLIDILSKYKIPVIAGFQGISEDGEITTLGRGGSDTTAAIIGEAINALAIEIYTDVDGIMTADPRIVKDAAVLEKISYSEIFQMAEQGAKVIHPNAVEIAMRNNIPLIIKNTFNDKKGTVVSSETKIPKYCNKGTNFQVVTSIAHIVDRSQITIEDICSITENNILLQLAQNAISIDLINIFPDKMIFTIDGKHTEKAEELLKGNKCKYSIRKKCSKISAVGNRMRGVPGVMASIVNALTRQNIEVLQTSDSHTTISCLVKGQDTEKAVLALHNEFNQK